MRNIIDISKRHRLYVNTFGDVEIYSPQYEFRHKWSKHVNPNKENCKTPIYSRCESKLLSQRIKLEPEPQKNHTGAIIVFNFTCIGNNCTYNVNIGDLHLYKRRSMPASTRKCIERLGKKYVQCLLRRIVL